MADFFQNGSITTLHNLTRRSIVDLERELSAFAQKRSIGLVLPSLYSELEGPALENIVQELMKVPYLNQIVIGLDRADEKQFAHAKEYFSRLPQEHTLLWHDGPRLKRWIKSCQNSGWRQLSLVKGAMFGTVSALCLLCAMLML